MTFRLRSVALFQQCDACPAVLHECAHVNHSYLLNLLESKNANVLFIIQTMEHFVKYVTQNDITCSILYSIIY